MSKTFEITGCISKIKPITTFQSGFQKQTLVLNDKDDKYPQEIAIDFTRDGVKKLEQFQQGDHVTVTFAIQGREWNDRHFVDLKGLRIERAVKLGGESYVGQPVPAPAPAPAAPAPQQNYEELPF